MLKYKLTDQNMCTHDGFQWTLGKAEETSGEDELCSPGWLHYYHSPLLAVILNPIHAGIDNPRLFEAEAEGKHLDDNELKGGCTRLTLVKELAVPNVTSVNRTAFAILCALRVYRDKSFVAWAKSWLDGSNRSTTAAASANAAASAASAASYAYAAAYAAAAAANAAANAAYAAYAASVASAADINLIELAEQAMKY